MAIEVRPARDFPDVAAVLGPKRPDANVCWCLSYRLTTSKENRELAGPARGERVRRLVAEEPPPGVLAHDGMQVVGWAAVHPRADTSFARNRRIPRVDDLDVWRCGASASAPATEGRASPTTWSRAPWSSPARTGRRQWRPTRWTTTGGR